MAVPPENTADLKVIELPTLTEAERKLSGRELAAYQFLKKHPQPPLSPDTQSRLFALFLQGTDCVRIAQLNRGISLGQIVQARIQGCWDQRRQEHLDSMMANTASRLQQISVESIDFVADQLAAAHRLYGERLKRYLSTGDEKELGGFSIHGFKTYKEAVDLLKTLSGADSKHIKHTHVVEPQPETPPSEKTVEAERVVTPIDRSPRSIIRGALAAKKQ